MITPEVQRLVEQSLLPLAGEQYSLTQIYWRLRKQYGIERTDSNLRRWRPYHLRKHLPGTRTLGKHVVADKATALEFGQRLYRWIQEVYKPEHSAQDIDVTPSEKVLAHHSEEELLQIFDQMYRQNYGDDAPLTFEGIIATVQEMAFLLRESLLEEDKVPSRLPIAYDDCKLPKQAWVARLLLHLDRMYVSNQYPSRRTLADPPGGK